MWAVENVPQHYDEFFYTGNSFPVWNSLLMGPFSSAFLDFWGEIKKQSNGIYLCKNLGRTSTYPFLIMSLMCYCFSFIYIFFIPNFFKQLNFSICNDDYLLCFQIHSYKFYHDDDDEKNYKLTGNLSKSSTTYNTNKVYLFTSFFELCFFSILWKIFNQFKTNLFTFYSLKLFILQFCLNVSFIPFFF